MEAKEKSDKKPKRLDPLTKRKQRNPKAFAINAPRAAERRFRRKQDLAEKRYHIPLIDRAPLEPPPVVVAVVGPPKVGKTTLIKSLVKHFTKHGLGNVTGPITIVTGKKRRVTFIECNNDLHSMIDIAKIADLVLLMVDASFGFEMELFEFLNICQSHGFPKIMAVLTHLDLMKSEAEKKRVTKMMKKRFWTEIYKGAKLFFVKGVMHGIYGKRDTQNIAQKLSVMKFKPLTWQSEHPYVVVDRLEDLTNPERIRLEREGDRRVSMYGYVRGTPLMTNSEVHIPGCGDFRLRQISAMPDPCPLPNRGEGKKVGRSLNQKERTIYAPFCGVGGVLCDKDAVYIDIAGAHSFSHKMIIRDSENIVDKILDSRETIDSKMQGSDLRLFAKTPNDMEDNGEDKQVDDDEDDDKNDDSDTEVDDQSDESSHPVISKLQTNNTVQHTEKYQFDDDDDDDDLEGDTFDVHGRNSNQKLFDEKKGGAKLPFGVYEELNDDDELDDEELAELASIEGEGKNNDEAANSNGEDEDDDFGEGIRSNFKWKKDLDLKAETKFFKRQNDCRDVQRLVYGHKSIHAGLPFGLDEELDDRTMRPTENSVECTIERALKRRGYSVEKLRRKFQFDLPSDTEDYESGGNFNSNANESGGDYTDDGDDGDDDSDAADGEFNGAENGAADDNDDDEAAAKERMLKKLRKKSEFDAQYDTGDFEVQEKTHYEMQKDRLAQQASANRIAFEGLDEETRLKVEGFRSGLYIRMEFERVPANLVDKFDPDYPLIVGGLNAGEIGDGYVRVRLKKHRWCKRLLKTRDPLIVSMGWRRFQTVPLYHVMDDNMRNRALKYTPWHLHCLATFWAPPAPQGTGLVAFQQTDQFTSDFRIAATGVVLDLNKSVDIVKKLKLVGYPMEVFTKSAFIKGMFSSSLEASKFEGAPIRTVSGIRGLIKKPLRTPEGAFRAAFEDKILMSDIVFLRTWFHVEVPRFCLTIKTLLMPKEEREKWCGARTSGRIRFEEGIKSINSANPDSIYKPVARKQFNFRPFSIPKQLQKELPYKDKPKFIPKQDDKIHRVSALKTEAEKRRLEALIMMGSLQKERILKHKEKRLKMST